MRHAQEREAAELENRTRCLCYAIFSLPQTYQHGHYHIRQGKFTLYSTIILGMIRQKGEKRAMMPWASSHIMTQNFAVVVAKTHVQFDRYGRENPRGPINQKVVEYHAWAHSYASVRPSQCPRLGPLRICHCTSMGPLQLIA